MCVRVCGSLQKARGLGGATKPDKRCVAIRPFFLERPVVQMSCSITPCFERLLLILASRFFFEPSLVRWMGVMPKTRVPLSQCLAPWALQSEQSRGW